MSGNAISWLQRDEDGIDFAKDLGIIALEDPAPLGFVVGIEDSEVVDLRVLSFFLGPDPILVIRLLYFGIVEVVGVENQRFALCEEDAAKGWASLAVRVSVDHIHDVQVAGTHQVADIVTHREKLVFAI